METLEVVKFYRTGSASVFDFVVNGSNEMEEDGQILTVHRAHMIRDGYLEMYMEAYHMPPEDTLIMLLLDAHDETVNIPPVDGPKVAADIATLMQNRDKVIWSVDVNDCLAQMYVTRDSHPELSSQWLDQRRMQESAVEGYQRRKEELEAAEYMDAMPTSRRSELRSDLEVNPSGSVGLGITYVP